MWKAKAKEASVADRSQAARLRPAHVQGWSSQYSQVTANPPVYNYCICMKPPKFIQNISNVYIFCSINLRKKILIFYIFYAISFIETLLMQDLNLHIPAFLTDTSNTEAEYKNSQYIPYLELCTVGGMFYMLSGHI